MPGARSTNSPKGELAGLDRHSRFETQAREPKHNSSPTWQLLAMRPASIQAKLTISQPGDPYEQEADNVADRVMRMEVSAATGNKSRIVQRKCDECEEEEEKKVQRKEGEARSDSDGGVPPIVHQALRSSGRPLDSDTRSFMESSFGHDFGDVRIHSDAKAAESARAVNALAYTVGRDIVLGAGQDVVEKGAGRRLLAHELTHVVQQSGQASAATSGPPKLARQAAPSPGQPESEAAPKEETRPLNEEERITAGAFEIWRKLVLGTAIIKLQSFTERIITGDPSLRSYNPSVKGRGLNADDLKTLLAIQEHLGVFANTFDWLNDPADKTFLEVTMKATGLMIQNLGMEVDKVFSNSCSNDDTMAMAKKPMWLCPDFFGEPGKNYKDPLCPALVLTHEYFHYLNVPGSKERITHGKWTLQSRPGDEALSSAYDLSNLAMALAVDKTVKCHMKN